MDGSQLPTEWTHLKKQLVSGVSDSKKRDVPLVKTDVDNKQGPMTQKADDAKMSDLSKMSKSAKASKKSAMAEKTANTTNR